MSNQPIPSSVVIGLVKAARKLGQTKGGFSDGITIAERIVALGKDQEFLAAWKRIRSRRARNVGAETASSLKWMLAHPGETATCAKVWPHLFSH